jgi:calcineurin-like phosphoesterase family protein
MTDGRTIAIGDIHGCAAALAGLVEALQPAAADCLIFLGDYIDRGPDSRGVLEQVLALQERCTVVPLLGNHEEMLLTALDGREALKYWLHFGGLTALESYGYSGEDEVLTADLWKYIPREHIEFLLSCRNYFEGVGHIFVHAYYEPGLPLVAQNWNALRWTSLPATPEPHYSGKIAVVGHTPQWKGEILDLGFLKCIDTNCCRGGWLTALDVDSGHVWQADQQGRLRPV